ncbi:hypothetical protein E2562_003837 [Oryza meyeriana var. granulata]|uniref:CHCH domain-containing protein n=1 Tax=Oryza meyeriana var. granulata TaxID=110450 RepID=A0A6G1CYN6_9ORYZ|nr:hypothetical protein E2562_003837 [Oryza meyeriana var. granulata]
MLIMRLSLFDRSRCSVRLRSESAMGRRGGGGGRGGRSSFRSSGAKAVPRAAPAKKPPTTAAKALAPATSSGNDSIIGSIGSAFFDGWGWSMGHGMMSRAMDAMFGPRTVNVVDTTPTATTTSSSSSSALAPATAHHPMADACGAHHKAFQDCISNHGIDIGKCQTYLDLLNDCRRDSAAVATTTIL